MGHIVLLIPNLYKYQIAIIIMKKSSFIVTPYKVEGEVDYSKLMKDFGSEEVRGVFLDKLKKMHPLLRRGFYFSHRDFPLWLKEAESGKKVSILSGRGPSEKMHLGHIVPFLTSKSLQDEFECNVYIPISEDEKFFVKKDLSFDNASKFAEDNILDILALGFKHGKTFVFRDFSYPKIYPYASRIAKLISYSTAKAVFGLAPENNIGWSFYPAVQSAHILMPQFLEGEHLTLVPVGIDQDPFIRLTRDIAENKSIGLRKPCAIHSKFLPGLKGNAKMSSSDSENDVIYLNDNEKSVEMKIKKYAFSGGRDSLEEHKKYGGNTDIDVSFQYLKFFFEEDDKKLLKIEQDYKSGKMLTSELKNYAISKINAFLKEHQKKKDALRKSVEKFMLG